VLVHGSGPNDRDETIGPNKPFRDLAQGLAAAGIATLRYDKRTFAFRKQINVRTLTLDQEVTDDAAAALEYCRTRQDIDSGKIFLLGHSMGGTMAPFIARRFAGLHGAILMAAASRPLDNLILEQNAVQGKIVGIPDAEMAKVIQQLKEDFARIKSGEAADDAVIQSMPAHYWRELLKVDMAQELRQLKIPVLVLQGGKDIQVTKADFDLIQKSLSTSAVKGNEFRFFPNLNHLFMDVSGQPTGAEYRLAGNVSKEAIAAIVAWLRQLP
jgi:dienelactone hydrolase